MPATIGCDAHKQFSVFVTIDSKGKTIACCPSRTTIGRHTSIFSAHCPPAARSRLKPPATGTGWCERGGVRALETRARARNRFP